MLGRCRTRKARRRVHGWKILVWPLVAYAATRAGYQSSTAHAADMPPDRRLANVESLGQALLWCILVPWAICFLVYALLHFTYPSDRRRFAEGNLRREASD